MDCDGRAADTDDAEQPSVGWIEYRGAAAYPRVVGANEVLGGEDLRGPPQHERRPDTAGPDIGLSPPGAFDETDGLGLGADRGIALMPQDVALGVGDDHHVEAVIRERDQPVAQDVDDLP